MVNEAPVEKTEHGLVPTGEGWWIINARSARWVERDGRGRQVPFTGWTADEAETFHRELGVNLVVLEPGQPLAIYHKETDAEGFFMIAGEALALVEGQERPLTQWDYFHCPTDCEHTIIGAGTHPCVLLAMSSRVNQGTDNWGEYTVDEVALKHNAGVEEATTDPGEAYARWKPSRAVKYGGWL